MGSYEVDSKVYTAGRVAAIILILAHHYWKHDDYELPDRIFQSSDFFNPTSHEYWVLIIACTLLIF